MGLRQSPLSLDTDQPGLGVLFIVIVALIVATMGGDEQL